MNKTMTGQIKVRLFKIKHKGKATKQETVRIAQTKQRLACHKFHC